MGGGPEKERMLIVLWDPEPKEITAEIRRRFPYIEVTYFCLNQGETEWDNLQEGVPKDLFKNATILVTMATLPDPKDVPDLKLIHVLSAGVDHMSKHPLVTDTDIDLTTSSGIHGPAIAEWVLMTTLAFTKHYNVSYELQKQHKWGSQKLHLYGNEDWVGKRVGIAGYGSIGRQVARLFSALGSTVVAYTATPRSTASARADHGYIIPGTGDPDGSIPTAWYSGTSAADLHTFLSQTLDAIVIALPLTPSTRHLFSTAEFSALSAPHPEGKPKPFVLNIARGTIIDQPALISALNDGLLRGAALDVTDPEPLPVDNPLWEAKNVIITPHISGLSSGYATRAYDVLMKNLERREKGLPLFNLVDRRKGY